MQAHGATDLQSEKLKSLMPVANKQFVLFEYMGALVA